MRALVAIFIARLLTPAEYGLAALSLVFASLVMVFNDLGLGAALIQRKQLTEVDRSTAFITSAATGVLFTALGVLFSRPIAELYGQPSAAPLLLALSFTFAISALGAPQQWLMLREMDFRRVETSRWSEALPEVRPPWRSPFAEAAPGRSSSQQVSVTVDHGPVVVRSPWRPHFSSRWRAFGISAGSARTSSVSGCSGTCRSTATRS